MQVFFVPVLEVQIIFPPVFQTLIIVIQHISSQSRSKAKMRINYHLQRERGIEKEKFKK